MLPVIGCASDEISVMARDCAYDFALLPDNAEIDAMGDRLAMAIDEHDALYERHCATEGINNE